MSCVMTFISTFNTRVDPADGFSRRRAVEKALPWSKNPFNKGLVKAEVEEDEVIFAPHEVPQWLELLFDLAWTTTFSGLTGGTPIKNAKAIASYSTFFVLAWWLWVSQVFYDTKFYTNDAFHRIILVLQFVAFGTLASFTAGFDIFNGLSHDASTDPVDEQVDDAYISRAFQAICLVLGVTRFLLALQYARVAILAKPSNARSIYLTIGSLVFSGAIFFVVFIILTVCQNESSRRVIQIVKFVLWGTALACEISVFIYAASPRGLVREGSMSQRLATLTTVVLGEGLNGLIGPLVSVAKSVGFNGADVGQILSMAFFILLVFALYFASFDTRGTISPARQKCIIFIHFPTHLILILMLEGMKSVMGFMTLRQSIESYFGRLVSGPNLDQIPSEFAKIGIDYTDVVSQMGSIPLGVEEQANATVYALASGFRLIALGGQAIFDQFNVLTDDLEQDFHSYVFETTPQDFAAEDAIAILNLPDMLPPHLGKLLSAITVDQLSPISWIAAAAGLFLFCLLFLTLVRRGPRNRYQAWDIAIRFVTASTLMCVTFLNLGAARLVGFVLSGALLPTILAIYFLQYAVDYIIHLLLANELDRRERAVAS